MIEHPNLRKSFCHAARIGLLLTAFLVWLPAARAASISLTGSTANWKAVKFTSTNQFDYPNDPQAGAADLDIVGDANHPMIYTQYDDKGTTSTSDDQVAFRIRVGNPKTSGSFNGRVLVGMDANADGRLDLYVSADGKNDVIKIWAPGNCNSPPCNTAPNNRPTTRASPPRPREHFLTPRRVQITAWFRSVPRAIPREPAWR